MPILDLFLIYSINLVAGASIVENTSDVSSYSYDSSKRELVSYDTPNIVKLKANYINSHGLGGSMFWEVSYYTIPLGLPLTCFTKLSTDKVGGESLVGTAAGVLGALDQTTNHIKYGCEDRFCTIYFLIVAF
jgi:chitinase